MYMVGRHVRTHACMRVSFHSSDVAISRKKVPPRMTAASRCCDIMLSTYVPAMMHAEKTRPFCYCINNNDNDTDSQSINHHFAALTSARPCACERASGDRRTPRCRDGAFVLHITHCNIGGQSVSEGSPPPPDLVVRMVLFVSGFFAGSVSSQGPERISTKRSRGQTAISDKTL